jgi:hypothetical protein
MKPIVGWDSLRLETQIQLEHEKEDGPEPERKLFAVEAAGGAEEALELFQPAVSGVTSG